MPITSKSMLLSVANCKISLSVSPSKTLVVNWVHPEILPLLLEILRFPFSGLLQIPSQLVLENNPRSL